MQQRNDSFLDSLDQQFCWPIITACRFLEYPTICNIRISWSPELGCRWRVGSLFVIIQSNCSCMQSFSSNRMWCYSIRWLCWWPLHPSQSAAKSNRTGLLQSWPYLEVWFQLAEAGSRSLQGCVSGGFPGMSFFDFGLWCQSHKCL